MGNLKFVSELMKLTGDIEEREAGLVLGAAIVAGSSPAQRQAIQRLLRKMANGKSTPFDYIENLDADEIDLMKTLLCLPPARMEVATEASDAEQQMTPTTKVKPKIASRIKGGKVAVIEAPAEARPPLRLFDGLQNDAAGDEVLNRVNVVRKMLLPVPKKGTVTLKELQDASGLSTSQIHPVIQQLRWDKILRRKRGITGKFLRGVYVKTASANAIIKRKLQCNNPS